MKRVIKVRNTFIGGDYPVTIQSMTNTLTRDAAATINQINELALHGCQIIRVSVPDIESAEALPSIISNTTIPLVADIHYDYKLAIKSAENGADKIRINPGNIGSMDNVRYLAAFLSERKIPIRIGVNSGSIPKDIYSKYGSSGEALYHSAMSHVRILEECNFNDIVISVKSSNVKDTITAYRLLDKACDYPLHIGVTEAGVDETGIVKSCVGIGILLNEGIGNTLRVSLSGNPVKEVIIAKKILQSLDLCDNMPEIISCPTCARTMINVEAIAREVEKRLSNVNQDIKVAIMGCVVNGPGEAREADIGIAGGKDKSAIFMEGKIIATVANENIMEELMKRIDEIING